MSQFDLNPSPASIWNGHWRRTLNNEKRPFAMRRGQWLRFIELRYLPRAVSPTNSTNRVDRLTVDALRWRTGTGLYRQNL